MKLEKGMIIYRGINKCVVDRVTEKQAVIKINEHCEKRFDIEQKDPFHMYARGDTGYGVSSYSIETPEIISNVKRYHAIRSFELINPNILTIDQIERIVEISKEGK